MISQTYRLFSPRQIRIDLIDEQLGDEDIIIRPTYLSICAADQRYYTGRRDKAVLKKKLPMALIHEAVGELKGLFNSEANGFTLRLFDWLESVDNFVLNDNAECALDNMIATAKRTCKSRLQMLQALEG